jgi:hypothetical protein
MAMAMLPRYQPLPISALINGASVEFATQQEKFDALVEVWRSHTRGRSVVTFDHIAYSQIIGMGVIAIPMLLRRVMMRERNWFYALTIIAGEAAHKVTSNGDLDACCYDWLRWGVERGYLPDASTAAREFDTASPPVMA